MIASVVLVSILAFYVLRKTTARRAVTPPPEPQFRIAASAVAERADAASGLIVQSLDPLDPASTLVLTSERATAPRYILGPPHDAATHDATSAMLDGMCGPGICTPRVRQVSSGTKASA